MIEPRLPPAPCEIIAADGLVLLLRQHDYVE
jgi:hypothetical protein